MNATARKFLVATGAVGTQWGDEGKGKIVDWLVKKNCQMVVIACNTITATAIDRLRQRYPVPFVGTEPAVKQGGVVLATPTAAASQRYKKLAQKYLIKTLACPGLAEAIEHGRKIALFLPQLPENTVTVILGCTHYILVKAEIQKIYGHRVSIIDPSEAIARQAEKMLPEAEPGAAQFYTTGSSIKATRRATSLLKRRIIFTKCVL